jgi:hypothetical protein
MCHEAASKAALSRSLTGRTINEQLHPSTVAGIFTFHSAWLLDLPSWIKRLLNGNGSGLE